MGRTLFEAGKSGNTQRLARTILRPALGQAERRGYVARNVVALTDAPAVKVDERPVRTPERAKQLFDAPVTTAVPAVISSFSSFKRLTGLTDIRSEDGPPTVNREYTEASGGEWMILSAKHGSSTRRTSFAGRPMSPWRAERPRSDGTYFDELKPDCNQSPRLITALRLSLTVRPHGQVCKT